MNNGWFYSPDPMPNINVLHTGIMLCYIFWSLASEKFSHIQVSLNLEVYYILLVLPQWTPIYYHHSPSQFWYKKLLMYSIVLFLYLCSSDATIPVILYCLTVPFSHHAPTVSVPQCSCTILSICIRYFPLFLLAFYAFADCPVSHPSSIF